MYYHLQFSQNILKDQEISIFYVSYDMYVLYIILSGYAVMNG